MKKPPQIRKDQLQHPKDERSSFNGDKRRPQESQGFMARRAAQGLGEAVESTNSPSDIDKKRSRPVLSRSVNPKSQPPCMPTALSDRQRRLLHRDGKK